MKIEIAIGDIFDKMSILEIKSTKTTDSLKHKNIQKELKYLTDICEEIEQTEEVRSQYIELKKTNNKLWEIEDKIRIKEKKQEFDNDFIELARSVYITNDYRAKIKKQINILLNSNFIEEKIYS